jgi:hypothetical protein
MRGPRVHACAAGRVEPVGAIFGPYAHTMTTFTRSSAARLTLLAQAAAALLGAGALAVVSGVWPARAPAPSTEPPSVDPQTGMPLGQAPVISAPGSGTSAGRVSARIDAEGIAARLALVSNAPKQPETPADPVATDTTPDTDPQQPAPTTLADRIKYLGRMTVGQAAFALLRVDDKQVVAQPGLAVRGVADGEAPVVLLRAGPDEALFRGASAAPIRVPLAAPVQAALTVFDSAATPTPAKADDPAAARIADRGVSPLLDSASRLSPEQRRQSRTDAMWERRMAELNEQVASGQISQEDAELVRAQYARYQARRTAEEGAPE